jgi:hypothetical protein
MCPLKEGPATAGLRNDILQAEVDVLRAFRRITGALGVTAVAGIVSHGTSTGASLPALLCRTALASLPVLWVAAHATYAYMRLRARPLIRRVAALEPAEQHQSLSALDERHSFPLCDLLRLLRSATGGRGR